MRRSIKASLRRAVNALPRGSYEAMAGMGVERQWAPDGATRQPADRVRRAWGIPQRLGVAMGCLAVVIAAGSGILWERSAVDSWITLDINPSFEITANRRDRVLEVQGLNADAVELLEDRQFRGETLDDAMAVLFSAMASRSYLTPEKNTVLLSVRSSDAGRRDALERELAGRIEQVLAQTPIAPRVVCQTLEDDAVTREQAAQYGVSAGKIQLARQAQARASGETLEQLTALSPEQLLARLSAGEQAAEPSDSDDDFDEDSDVVAGGRPASSAVALPPKGPPIPVRGDGSSEDEKDTEEDKKDTKDDEKDTDDAPDTPDDDTDSDPPDPPEPVDPPEPIDPPEPVDPPEPADPPEPEDPPEPVDPPEPEDSPEPEEPTDDPEG